MLQENKENETPSSSSGVQMQTSLIDKQSYDPKQIESNKSKSIICINLERVRQIEHFFI